MPFIIRICIYRYIFIDIIIRTHVLYVVRTSGGWASTNRIVYGSILRSAPVPSYVS